LAGVGKLGGFDCVHGASAPSAAAIKNMAMVKLDLGANDLRLSPVVSRFVPGGLEHPFEVILGKLFMPCVRVANKGREGNQIGLHSSKWLGVV